MNLTLISSQPWIIHRWIILTPSSQLTSEIWRGCEYYNLKWPSRTILLNDSLEWFSCHAIGCWWFVRRFFKYHRCIFSQRNHAVPRFILLSKQWHWEQSFTKTISNYFCVISPYEFRICWKSCWKVDKFFTIELNKKEEALTLESFSISFNQIQMIILHLSGTVGYFSIFSFLSLCFCSTNR